MDSFSVFPYQEPNPVVEEIMQSGSYLDLNDNQSLSEWFNDWIELSEIATNQSQLYHQYRWNYLQLINGIQAMLSDEIISTHDNGTNQTPQIVINGYVINFVSSGDNLIDYLRSYYRHLRKQGINVLNDFELMANSLFDSNYYYSLLGELRNQAQHGQLLVSMYRTEAGELKACFDLEQLHRPRLYRMRDKSNCTIENLINRIYSAGGATARLAFTVTIDQLNKAICDLYSCFLRCFIPLVSNLVESARQHIDSNEEFIFMDSNNIPYLPLLDNEIIRFLEARPEITLHMLHRDQEEAQKDLADAERCLEKTKSAFRPISSNCAEHSAEEQS